MSTPVIVQRLTALAAKARAKRTPSVSLAAVSAPMRPVVDCVTLTLPLPVSLNAAYSNRAGKGRVATEAHRQWKQAAGWKAISQKPGRIEGAYRLELYLPADMPGDVDNRPKLVSDLCVELGITPDDSKAWSVLSTRSHDVAPGTCRVVARSVEVAE